MTTPAANTSGGRLFHTVSGWRARPDYLIETAEGLVLSSSNPARVPGLDPMPLMWRS